MPPIQQVLQQRRVSLGLSYAQLAARSGVSQATAKRILLGNLAAVSIGHVAAVAEAMGVTIVTQPVATPEEFKERAAQAQASRLVAMVQGTSALEAQAVPTEAARELISGSVHRLMAGSPRRVWAQ